MNSAAPSSRSLERPRYPVRGPAQDTWELLRLPLILTLIGMVTTISAVTWNRLSCCAGGANIGAGMLGLLGLLGLTLLAGGAMWGILTVMAGYLNR